MKELVKIIAVDNYNREHISDVLIAERVDAYYATIICKLLNHTQGDRRFFKVVPLDHKLYVFEP